MEIGEGLPSLDLIIPRKTCSVRYLSVSTTHLSAQGHGQAVLCCDSEKQPIGAGQGTRSQVTLGTLRLPWDTLSLLSGGKKSSLSSCSSREQLSKYLKTTLVSSLSHLPGKISPFVFICHSDFAQVLTPPLAHSSLQTPCQGCPH